MEKLNQYMAHLSTSLGPAVIKAFKEQIDIEANNCFETMKNNTPVSTREHKHLKDTLVMKAKEDVNRYGYTIDYDGYDENGKPYSLIARSINKGALDREPTRHIDKAIKKLKGMDDRIGEHVVEAINNIEK